MPDQKPATLYARLRAAAAVALGRADQKLIADLFPTQRGSPPVRGSGDLLKSYSEMPWLRATVHRVAVGVGSAQWKAMATKGKPDASGKRRFVQNRALQRGSYGERHQLTTRLKKAGDLVELDTHPLLDLLHNPNPYMTGVAFRRLLEMHIDLVGEGAWLIERDGMGMPSNLWPVPPHWISDTPKPRRPTFWITLPQGGWQGEVPMTEVIWFVDPDPYQPYGRGAGTAKSLGDELETDEFAAKHTKQFFYNQARPDLLITVKGARDADLRAAEQRWLDRLQGFFRAFKPMFVNREIDVKEIGTTFRDMQFTQLRQQERDTIIQVFGLPPEMLGILESSNRATIDAADYIMAKHVLVPRLELIRETIQERLAPMFDERLVIEYESPIAEDKTQQLEAAKAMPAAPTVDEWREMMGLEELENGKGKLHLVSGQIVAVEDLADLKPAPAPPPGTPPPGTDPALPPGGDGGTGEEPKPADGEEPKPADEGKRRRMIGPGRRSRSEKGAADDFQTFVHRVADALAPRMRRRFLELIDAARASVDLRTLETVVRSGNVEAIFRVLEPIRAALEVSMGGAGGLRGVLQDTVDAAANATARELVQELGISVRWSDHNARSVEWIQRHAAEMVTNISETTRDAIRQIIERSFKEGIAPSDAARMIRDVVGLRPDQARAVVRFRERLAEEGVKGEELEGRVDRYAGAQLRRRALVIARTETIAAANGGQQLLWEQGISQGLIERGRVRKVWITTADELLDQEVCEPMPFLDDNKDVPVDGLFTTGEGDLVSHPPAHPNCRCAIALEVRQ